MMKHIIFILVLVFAQINISAQTKQQAEKSFVRELNKIIKNSDEHHWGYEGKMLIEKPFSIDDKGILSVAVRYVTDSSNVQVQMEAPIYKAKYVLYDYYLILEYADEDVTVKDSENGNTTSFKNDLFHLGAPRNGYKKKDELQLMLDKILKFY